MGKRRVTFTLFFIKDSYKYLYILTRKEICIGWATQAEVKQFI